MTIWQDLRDFADRQGLNDQAALPVDMQDKAVMFAKGGAALYRP